MNDSSGIKPLRRLVGSILFIALIVLSLQPIRAKEQNEYNIATVAWMGWSPLHVAHEKGFWADQGIVVNVVDFDNPVVLLEAIRAGRVNFAMDMVGTVVGEYMTGRSPVCLIETNWSDGGDKIIIQSGGALRDFIGMPLGVFLNQPSCLYFLGTYLATQELTLKHFRIVEIGAEDLSAQFVAGRIPVIVNYDPWNQSALTKGNGVLLASSSDYEGCIPEGMWTYRDTLGATPHDDMKKILIGWVKAVEWANQPENREEFFSILRRRTFKNEKNIKDDDLLRLWDNVRIHQPAELYERNRQGGGLDGYLSDLRVFLKKNDRLKRNYDNREIFDNHLIVEVLSEYNKK